LSEVGYSGKHRVKGLKRTIVIDAQGNPLALVLAPANRHDLGLAQATVGQATLPDRKQRLKRLGADKGYDAESLRRFLRQRQITPCLSYRVNHVQPVPVAERREHRYSQQRWKVERTFAWMNNYRRLDRFMEKKATTYQGFCHLMFLRYYVQRLTK